VTDTPEIHIPEEHTASSNNLTFSDGELCDASSQGFRQRKLKVVRPCAVNERVEELTIDCGNGIEQFLEHGGLKPPPRGVWGTLGYLRDWRIFGDHGRPWGEGLHLAAVQS
jgi:hypothetical protein